jgi:hypothetical protein
MRIGGSSEALARQLGDLALNVRDRLAQTPAHDLNAPQRLAETAKAVSQDLIAHHQGSAYNARGEDLTKAIRNLQSALDKDPLDPEELRTVAQDLHTAGQIVGSRLDIVA